MTQNSQLKSFGILLVIGVIAGAVLISTNNNLANSLTQVPVPIDHFSGDDKAIVLLLTFFDDDTVIFNSGLVSEKNAAGHAGEPPLLYSKVIDVKDIKIDEFNLWNPLWARVYDGDGSHSVEIQPEATSRVIFPFQSDASFITIKDVIGNQEITTVDVKPIIHDFCIDNLSDPDCYESDLAIDSLVVNPPPIVLLGQSEEFSVQSIILNHGPEAPSTGVDGIFNQQITNISPGITINPTGIVDQEEFGLFVNAPRENNQAYIISCLEPGVHEATFTSTIEALSAAVIDLDESNNSKEFVLSVDCAIPVQINIHPGSDPNSVNIIKKKGVIPLAILNTLAGEYGLPIDVDATMVVPSGVRFSSLDVLFNTTPPNGASEFHNKGHLEDSFELDEITQDGDQDMVLHFKAQETGLVGTDTEGCITGKIIMEGMQFTIFGCDDIRVPS